MRYAGDHLISCGNAVVCINHKLEVVSFVACNGIKNFCSLDKMFGFTLDGSVRSDVPLTISSGDLRIVYY